jgi:hypothetical protein
MQIDFFCGFGAVTNNPEGNPPNNTYYKRLVVQHKKNLLLKEACTSLK